MSSWWCKGGQPGQACLIDFASASFAKQHRVPCVGDGAANTIGVAEEVGRKVIELSRREVTVRQKRRESKRHKKSWQEKTFLEDHPS